MCFLKLTVLENSPLWCHKKQWYAVPGWWPLRWLSSHLLPNVKTVWRSGKLQAWINILAGCCKQRAKYAVTPGICGVHLACKEQNHTAEWNYRCQIAKSSNILTSSVGKDTREVKSVLTAGCEHRAKRGSDVEVCGKTKPGKPFLFCCQ